MTAGADYVLAVKKNNRKLYESLELFFQQATEAGSNAIDYYETFDDEHGRKTQESIGQLLILGGWKVRISGKGYEALEWLSQNLPRGKRQQARYAITSRAYLQMRRHLAMRLENTGELGTPYIGCLTSRSEKTRAE